MKENVFYNFSGSLLNSTFQATLEGAGNHLIYGEYSGVCFPIIGRHQYGNKMRDMLDTGWPNLFLISNKMKLLLEKNQLTGWKTFPIILYDKKGNVIAGYHGFSITGRCSPIDYSKSEIIERPATVDGPIRQYYKGIHIDGWDGSDFFIVEGTLSIQVTKKAANMIQMESLTNIKLIDLAKQEKDVRIINMARENKLENQKNEEE